MTERRDPKRELLARLLRERAASNEAHATRARARSAQIRALPRGGDLLTSFGQDRWWFDAQLQPESVWNMLSLFSLTGPLDVELLRRSFEALVTRHESLRTVFPTSDGVPLQRILPPPEWTLPVDDLRPLHESARHDEASRIARAEIDAGFDLIDGPLIRTRLIRIADEEFLLVMACHHIISDGWSVDVILRDLTAIYGAYAAGTTPALPDLPVQYADFAAWHREWMSGDVLEEQRAYWKERMKGTLPRVDLPTDHPRPFHRTFRGASVPSTIDGELLASLREFSRREGVTLFTTLLTAYEILLSRYTAQDELLIGTFVSGRVRPELENLVGFFVNSLALRLDLSGEPTFREALQRTNRTVLDAYRHGDFPFDRLIEEIQPERALGLNPIISAGFNKLSVSFDQHTDAGGVRFRVLPSYDLYSVVEGLNLFVSEGRDRVDVWLLYGTEIYERETIARMSSQFQTILRGAVASPATAVSRLPMLDEQERAAIAGYSAGPIQPVNATTVHEMVDRVVRDMPDRVALLFGDEERTYSELSARANRLARHLRSAGIQRGDFIAVCMPRSMEMVTCLLAVLKAGAAYVPLDAALPAGRLAFMVSDSGARFVLTAEELCASLPSFENARVISVDAGSVLEHGDAASPEVNVGGDDAAYMIYTSGSTGTPKGVVVTHANVVNLLDTLRVAPGSGPEDVWLALTTVSFDMAVPELWLSLAGGGRMAIVTREVAVDAERLMQAIDRYGVTVLQTTPSTWRMLIDAGWTGQPSMCGWCGGEQLPRDLADQILARVGQAWHLYGPTEATVLCTGGRMEAGTDTPHIGRPIANTTVHIVDAHGAPVPIGAAGEIWIGGNGVARGYHNRADLSAEKFVADPFAPGGRAYRTGDLGRWRRDGTIEYLGRRDQQVKIRGYRIELQEIESMLRTVEGVRDAVVEARDDHAGTRLVAYMIPEAGAAFDESAIIAKLQGRLPNYMVPRDIVTLDSFPRTPGGKIDRRALPAPVAADVPRSQAPRTPEEEAIAKIWCDVIGVPAVGVTDNFFAVGGHSLLAARVISRMRDAFGMEISVRDLFEMQTVAELAAHLVAQRRSGPRAGRIMPVSRETRIPLSSAQRRLWFFDQLEPGSSAYNMPVGLLLRGTFDGEAFDRALTALRARHESLRTTFPGSDGVPVQVVQPPSFWKSAVTDFRHLSTQRERLEQAFHLAAEEAALPFDLAAGPVVRARTMRLEDDLHFVMITMHHIVVDGWSLDILVRDLGALYEECTTGRRNTLPALAVQYADVAAWQHQWLASGACNPDLTYWKHQLEGMPPALHLPLDFARPATQTYTGASSVRTLGNATRDALEALSRNEGATLFMTLLAAFDVVVARQSGQQDICIGVPVAGRNRTESENLIGLFVNTLPVRVRTEASQTFREVLHRVREACLGAFAHQDVPFERIVEEVQPDRDLSRTPLFQVMFNMTRFGKRPTIELADLRLEPAQLAPTWEVQSKFDLTLYVTEDDDGLRLAAVYNANLFRLERIDAFVDQLVQTLDTVALDPDSPANGVSLVTPASQSALPDPTIAQPSEWLGAVHTRFSMHARSAPDRIAVADTRGQRTYAELDAESNRLARFLGKSGLGREDVVAINASRDGDLAWAMLGVLKAGAAFVIVDPAYPAARTLQALRIARPAGFIQLEGAEHPAPELEAYLATVPGLVCVRSVRNATVSPEPWSHCSADALGADVAAGDLAYIVFTSGSTGEPKGVAGTHAPLSHFFAWHEQHGDHSSGDRFSVLGGLAHDPLLRDILGAFWVGATVCMPDASRLLAPGYLRRWLMDERVSVIHGTPSMLSVIAEGARDDERLTHARRVYFGADVLTDSTVAVARRLAPDARFVNFYGASETPQAVAWYDIPSTGPLPSRIPVGRGIDDVQLLVLNPAGNLCGIGELGEIHVRTPYLSRGYVGDAAQTTERFTHNPFRHDPQDRVYRTGDLGRYRGDGHVELAGRADRQVKIRGFRVEIGDVEAALSVIPGVSRAVVVADAGRDGHDRLVAYVVGDEAMSSADLRDAVRARLPEYMIPSQFAVVSEIPLTPNGKVDRTRLPPLAPIEHVERIAPRTPLEERVFAAWTDVLGHAAFGVHENFFELGGHSLMATQVLSRLRASTGVELPVRVLFEAPTVAALASRAEGLTVAPASAVEEREEISL